MVQFAVCTEVVGTLHKVLSCFVVVVVVSIASSGSYKNNMVEVDPSQFHPLQSGE